MKKQTEKIAYGYNLKGVLTCEIQLREDPRIPGHYPLPARSMVEKPPIAKSGEYVCTEDKKSWVTRVTPVIEEEVKHESD